MDAAGVRGDRRPPLATRAAATAAVLIGAALLAAACGGSSHVGGALANRTPRQQALAYTQCLRSHGAPHYPGPNGDGVFIMTPQNAADFRSAPASAQQACSYLSRHMRRSGKPELNPVLQAQVNRANLAFARCMRRHGIHKFPDSWGGGINIGRMRRLGIDTNSPRFSAALKACGF
jgi:hypothetical protein